MKYTYYKKQIYNFIYRNKLTFILLLFCLVAGIAAGSIFSVTVSSDVFDELGEYINNFVSAYSLQRFDSLSVVKYSLINNVKTLIVIVLSCLWRAFVVIPFVATWFLGFRFGFTTTSIIRIFGTKGIPFAIISGIPQLVIFTPFFILYCVYNVKLTLSLSNTTKRRFIGSVNNILNAKNLLLTLAFVCIILVTAMFDGYVVPLVLKPVCSILGE